MRRPKAKAVYFSIRVYRKTECDEVLWGKIREEGFGSYLGLAFTSDLISDYNGTPYVETKMFDTEGTFAFWPEQIIAWMKEYLNEVSNNEYSKFFIIKQTWYDNTGKEPVVKLKEV